MDAVVAADGGRPGLTWTTDALQLPVAHLLSRSAPPFRGPDGNPPEPLPSGDGVQPPTNYPGRGGIDDQWYLCASMEFILAKSRSTNPVASPYELLDYLSGQLSHSTQ
ncbi:hypothetical protein Pma05_08720 [Plantactinospora mayteni]|uniref:Uncharacterized protein n=1 Tax=Plantactinospora mayteni TaxID=566021 RepID=A0ABQ4EHT9_9ACTN|nr:hypothetical protein Pma05_08720 [Plantactinospora mayteni]